MIVSNIIKESVTTRAKPRFLFFNNEDSGEVVLAEIFAAILDSVFMIFMILGSCWIFEVWLNRSHARSDEFKVVTMQTLSREYFRGMQQIS